MNAPVHPDTVFESEHLRVRRFSLADDAFILTLLNDPDWLRFIGDRNVHDLTAARRYLEEGPLAMYARHGFGLFLVALKADDTPIGMCGVLKRDTLDDVDLGFAFLPPWRGLGYAREAARATLDWAAEVLRLPRVVAITLPGNERSISLLETLGFAFRETVTAPGGETLRLYAVELS